MKNIIVLLIILFPFSFHSFCQSHKANKDTDWGKMNLKGKVKKYEQNIYDITIKNGEIVKGDMNSVTYFFNSSGYITEEYKSGSRDTSVQKTTYLYDEKGYLIRECAVKPSIVLCRAVYTYNDKGNIVEKDLNDETYGLLLRCTYQYDSKGNQIVKKEFSGAGELRMIALYGHDHKGNVIEEKDLDADSILTKKIAYKYDGKGNKIEERRYDPKGILIHKKKYRNYKKGSDVTDFVFSGDGTTAGRDFHKFDVNDRIIRVISGGKINTFKNDYEYDDHGNYTKVISYKNDSPKEMGTRVFEYYE
jgi:hypothetical protein